MFLNQLKNQRGIVQVYTITQSGKRFQKPETKFNQHKNIYGRHWNIKVERKRKYQKIICFGGAFSDAGNWQIVIQIAETTYK